MGYLLNIPFYLFFKLLLKLEYYMSFVGMLKNILVVSCMLVVYVSCQYTQTSGEKKEETVQLTLEYENSIDSIIEQLTLEEKVHLLHGTGKFWSGGIERLGVPEMQYADGPLGVREEIERNSWESAEWNNDSATFFPAGTALGATWNPKLLYDCGKAMAQEARARNKDILLVPAVNILRSPLNGRNYEYFTEDPYLNSHLVVPYVQGVQSENVAASVKHYAVNNQETNRGSINVELSERALREIYLPAFKAAVQKGQAFTVMGAYNKLRGEYLCENEYMLNHILKKEWGFRGVVVSDWGAVHNTINAANSGLDIEMGTDKDYEDFYFARPLINAVNIGDVDMKVVDDKVRRVLRLMYHIKLNQPTQRTKGSINTKEHSNIVYNAASESVVLVKNEKKILPLQKDEISRIAIIGDNATRTFGQGGFGAGVKSKYEVTPLEAFKNKLGDKIEIAYSQGYREKYIPERNNDKTYGRIIDYSTDEELVDKAVELAASSDVAIVFAGSNRHTESESIDREDMKLPFAQEQLINEVVKANKKTIVVFTLGTAYDLKEMNEIIPAMLISWFNGAESGNALCDVITGQINPSGKLPFTFPKKLEDSPAHALNAFPGTKELVTYNEDIFVGYKWFDKQNIEPLYCFGYGLSYSKFNILNARLNSDEYITTDTIELSIDIKNIGNYDGAEVIQVYSGIGNSKIVRVEKELKAFRKVWLKKGESNMVKLKIPASSLAYYNEKSMSWEVESGQYELKIGNSSRNIYQIVKFNIKN